MTCVEAEQESSAALLCILCDLDSGSHNSISHSVTVYFVKALDLVFTDPIRFDTLLKLIGPLSGTRHVRILEFVA